MFTRCQPLTGTAGGEQGLVRQEQPAKGGWAELNAEVVGGNGWWTKAMRHDSRCGGSCLDSAASNSNHAFPSTFLCIFFELDLEMNTIIKHPIQSWSLARDGDLLLPATVGAKLPAEAFTRRSQAGATWP